MKPLRILFISHGWGLGGAERVMLETIEALDRLAFEPSVVVPKEGQLEAAARRLGAWTHVFRAPWWLPPLRYSSRDHFRVYLEGLPRFVEPMARLIRERHIDLVYSCSSPILHGALAALVTRTAHLHHMPDLLGWPHLALRMPFGSVRVAYGILGRLASLVVCVGRTIREDVGSAIPRNKCRIVPLAGPQERMAAIAAESRVDGVCHLHFRGYRADVPGFLRAVDLDRKSVV